MDHISLHRIPYPAKMKNDGREHLTFHKYVLTNKKFTDGFGTNTNLVARGGLFYPKITSGQVTW